MKLKQCSRQINAATYTSVVRPVLCSMHLLCGVCISCITKAPEQVQRLAARYVHNDYTCHTTGCVTDMPSGQMPYFQTLEAVQNPSWFSRIVDIDKTAYLKPGDNHTRSHTGFFIKNTPSMRSTTTRSSQEQPRNVTDYQTA